MDRGCTAIGIIGLGTMGANLARNAARNGATVAVFNRTTEKMEDFMKAYEREGDFLPCTTLADLLKALTPPRAILIMVKAGEPVDEVIHELLSLKAKSYQLKAGDVLIDGGNSHYRDTERRIEALKAKSYNLKAGPIHFLGMGVSGGEKGALEGPSLMVGGSREAYDHLEPLLKKMAADDGDEGKCVAFLGPGCAGHFVKMVHNGIEYALMQLIAEAYDILKNLGGFSNEQLAKTFTQWNTSPELSSFLVEITAKIFMTKDPETGTDLIDIIRDRAGQKGTGKWTTEAAFDLGQGTPTIDAAVVARILSGEPRRKIRDWKKLPVELDDAFPIPPPERLQQQVQAALACSILCSYNQGFHLIEHASDTYQWNTNLGEMARIWRGGCIIRSTILERFQRACNPDPKIEASEVKEIVGRFAGGRQRAWRKVVSLALSQGVPVPAMAGSLSYYDTLHREHFPQNLTAAQRDYFGAHGYERIGREGTFHTEWE